MKKNKDNQKDSSLFYPVYFNLWNRTSDLLSELIKQIKDRIYANLDENQKVEFCQLTNLEEILKFSRNNFKKLLIILDQFEIYLKSSSPKAKESNFAKQLSKILASPKPPAHFLISISDSSYHHDKLEQLEKFLEQFKDFAWNKGYFELSGDVLSYQNQNKPSQIQLAKIEDKENFINTVSDEVKLNRLDRSDKSITSHHLQVIMERVWQESNKSENEETRILSLNIVKKIGEKDLADNEVEYSFSQDKNISQEKFEKLKLINQGFSKIIQDYVDNAIQDYVDNAIYSWIIPQVKSSSDRQKLITQVSQILYYLLFRASDQNCPSSDVLVHFANEETKALNLPLYNLKEENVEIFLAVLNNKRILRSVGFSQNGKELYEIYFDRLTEAIQKWQRKYLNQLCKISLPARAVAQVRQNKGDLGALLAIEAYNSCNYFDPHKYYLFQVDATLREILKDPYFSCRLDCSDFNQKPNEKDFWQVKFNSDGDGTMLAASNQDGSLWVWDLQKDVQKENSIPELLSWKENAHNLNNKPRDSGFDIALAFIRDSKMLISSGRDAKIELWDLSNLRGSKSKLQEIKLMPQIRDPNFLCPRFQIKLATFILDKDCLVGSLLLVQKYGFTSVSVIHQGSDTLLAAGNWTGNIWLWNISKPQQPEPFLKPLQRQLDWLAILTNWLNSLTDGLSKLFRRNNRQKNKPSDPWIWSVDASPNGKLLAAGGGDGIVYLWNIEDPEKPKLIRSLVGHKEEIFCVAFAPNGKLLASGSRDYSVHLWELRQINNSIQISPKKVFEGHKKGVRAIAFDSNSNKLASASEDQTIRVWNLENLEEESEVLEGLHGHSYGVCSVAFHPKNPQRLVSCSWDRTIRFWTLGSEPKIFNVSEKDPNIEVLAVTWIDEDETRFALVRSDGTVEIRDVNSTDSEQSLKHFPASKDLKISSVAFFKEGEQKKIKIALGSSSGSIDIWKLNCQELNIQKQESLEGHKDNDKVYKISSLAFSPDGEWLASVSEDEYKNNIQKVKLWDLNQPKSEPKPLEYQLGASVSSIAFYPNPKTLLSFWWKWYLKIQSNQPIDYEKLDLWLITLAYYLYQKWLAVVDKYGHIKLQDINQFEPHKPIPQEPCEDHPQTYGNETSVILAFSQDGNLLASCSSNNDLEGFPCVKLWSVNQSKKLSCKYENLSNYNLSPTSIAFSNKSKRLAVGYYDGTIQMWNLEKLNKRILLAEITWVIGWIIANVRAEFKFKAVQFIFSKLPIWNLENKIEPSSILRGHKEKVIMLDFSTDGKKLLSASYDNTVRLWTVETEDLANELKKKLYRRLTEPEKQEFLGVSPQLQNRSESS